MSQEMFPGRVTPMAAAGFVGLMSLFQHGRTFVLGLNVCLHRPQETYFCFFILGTMLYATVPCTGEIGSISLFVLCFLVSIRMYGGGFSTVSSYLKDMFGTRYVGAIYGQLLTARSMADIFGPVLVNYIPEYTVTHGVPKAQV
jgi:hypothetical protein